MIWRRFEGKGIKKIKGLQNLTNLEELVLFGPIERLEGLDKCNKLKVLDIYAYYKVGQT
ncbi:MAG: hypothetical protein KGD63_04060 [Candidatus Lokiarchaeota archaeon]|nr:hypothetical protein [Candidatus Lokiarchaeota archaeon]